MNTTNSSWKASRLVTFGRPGWREPAIVLVVALGLGVTGPFNTFAMLPLPQRLLYWAALVFANWLLWRGGFSAMRLLPARFRHWTWEVAVVGLLAYPLGSLMVLALHRTLGFWVPQGGLWSGWLYFFLWYAAVGLFVVTPLFRLARPSGRAKPSAEPPPLLQRLAPELRGPVLALSAEDHYVRVFTSRGNDLVLMRFSDALAELGSVKGSRVHRSHWVAAEAVSGIRRSGRSMVLILKDGRTVPVSRRYRHEALALSKDDLPGAAAQGRSGSG